MGIIFSLYCEISKRLSYLPLIHCSIFSGISSVVVTKRLTNDHNSFYTFYKHIVIHKLNKIYFLNKIILQKIFRFKEILTIKKESPCIPYQISLLLITHISMLHLSQLMNNYRYLIIN